MAVSKHHLLLLGETTTASEKVANILSDAGYTLGLVSSALELRSDSQLDTGDLLVWISNTLDDHALDLFHQLQARPDSPSVVVLSQGASVNEAVRVMQAGAVDYLALPVSRERLLRAVEFGLALSSRTDAHRSPPSSAAGPASAIAPKIIASNPQMRALLKTVERIADSDATVMITGESGTGKELLAAYIHARSGRLDKPFVAMNCAALPEQLAESELFGHEKGAFTGALQRKLGRFEQADGGSLLLDEIGELPLTMQAKLLRVLQNRLVDRVGGQAPVPVDVRIITTTNRDLKKMVAEGAFREDLYYRLKVLPFELPALRERPDDIPLLANTFMARFNEHHGRSIRGITSDALRCLEQYAWPGNIRELENTIERAVLISPHTKLHPEDLLLDNPDANPDTAIPPGTTVKEMERRLILSTLGQVNANRTRAAEMLGISIRTLRNKLNEYRSENPQLFKAAG